MKIKLLKKLRKKANKDLQVAPNFETCDYATHISLTYSYPVINKNITVFYSSLSPGECLNSINKELLKLKIEYMLYLVEQIRNRP